MYEEKGNVPVRETQIARETMQMVGLIENLFKVAEALEMRLESVLVKGGMESSKAGIHPQQPTVGLAIALAERNAQLVRLREKLEDLHGRIEL